MVKHKEVTIIAIATLTAFGFFQAFAGQKDNSRTPLDKDKQKIVKLISAAGQKPMIITKDQIALQIEVAKTKRFDAAIALIKSLSLSYGESINSDELESQINLLPAIELIKTYYGQDIGPLLYSEALGTKHKWLRARIALATRSILDKKAISLMNKIFSLVESKDPHSKEFLELLNRPILRVQLPMALSEHEQENIKKLQEFLDKKAKEKNRTRK